MIEKVTKDSSKITITFTTKREAGKFYSTMKAIADMGLRMNLVASAPETERKPR